MDSLSQYEKVPVELPQRLRALSVCVYHAGTRKGESRKVQSQVDFDAGFLLTPANQGQGCALPTHLCRAGVVAARAGGGRSARVSLGLPPQGNAGRRTAQGRREACERAGLPGLLSHDLRRSAVRNLKRAEVQDKIAIRSLAPL